jgi:hypothetical protein
VRTLALAWRTVEVGVRPHAAAWRTFTMGWRTLAVMESHMPL